ncbi:unnamed protein product [Sphagnum compactum]
MLLLLQQGLQQASPGWLRSSSVVRKQQEFCVPLLLLPVFTTRSHPWTCLRAFKRSAQEEHVVKVENHQISGGELEYRGSVPHGVEKVRLDAWLAGQLPRISRARVQSSIRQGLILVNGEPVNKVSYMVKEGDQVDCQLSLQQPMDAKPENIPLDIKYEDKHLLVINKPAHMVVHPGPGHSEGTLVNALLHHCGLPAMRYARAALQDPLHESEELDDDSDDDETPGSIVAMWLGPAPVIRPGIVHRLDKGTSGLLVVAKDEHTHEHLCDQFKARSVRRSYVSLTCGLPTLMSGRVEVPIGRDPRDRKRMAAIMNAKGGSRARSAASRFRVLEVIAEGGSALVEWRLETGRTHQIRVHAQHLGYPILGDETYGGTPGAALARLLPRASPSNQGALRQLVAGLQRPCLHALTLGFTHPWTQEEHNFTCAPPQDFEDTWRTLRQLG